VIRKVFISILFSFFIFALNNRIASAALLNINNKGELIWQVLGDSTNLNIPKPSEIQIKSIASNLPNNSEVSLSNTDGKITLNGMDVTNLKENLVEVEARGNSNDLKIGSVDNKFTIEENGLKAITAFPITVDPVKNELSVTTNSGSRLVSVLPYEAILSLMRGKFIDGIKGNVINLNESSGGQLEYVVPGTKKVNLFNVASINADVNSTISASNGEIIKIDEPQWLKFFGFLFS
jgi:hypothetical protein